MAHDSADRLKEMSDDQLIGAFNGKVENSGLGQCEGFITRRASTGV